jgi:mono/diheme cytochrome c family protein
VLVWALVTFLYAIEPPPIATAQGETDATARGRTLFEAHCRECHDGPAWSGDPTELARIGTHPELARGHARGTGSYRPAPLLRVREAAPYLHDGSVADLETLLSPEREAPGHRFGTERSNEERAALLAFLETL